MQERNSLASEATRDSVQPRSFQLAVNYRSVHVQFSPNTYLTQDRSHSGIVNCAHSVIQLITRFWPHTIDNLAQEQGIVDGLKPVFFHGWDPENGRYEQFLFGDS